jgi:hypothetical protein
VALVGGQAVWPGCRQLVRHGLEALAGHPRLACVLDLVAQLAQPTRYMLDLF